MQLTQSDLGKTRPLCDSLLVGASSAATVALDVPTVLLLYSQQEACSAIGPSQN